MTIPARAVRLLADLREGNVLRRQAAKGPAARAGGGYLYFLEPGGQRAPVKASVYVIKHKLVRSPGGDLLDKISQTFTIV